MIYYSITFLLTASIIPSICLILQVNLLLILLEELLVAHLALHWATCWLMRLD